MSLSKIQAELKAPKGQMNKFGGYKYRSCEDILEALKPLLSKHNSTLVINDDIVLVGERYYIKATATFTDVDNNNVSVSAFAREPENKKGMDESQITGAASSYARKYALNGLFAIDDTKDADATNEHTAPTPSKQTPTQSNAISEWVKAEFAKHNIESDKFKMFMRWDKLTAKEMLTQATKFYNNRVLWSDQLESYFTWLDNNENTALQGGE